MEDYGAGEVGCTLCACHPTAEAAGSGRGAEGGIMGGGRTGKSKSRFFDQGNAFFTIMGVVWDLIELNLLTLLLCLPVVTAGASLTAMHYVLWHEVRGEETYVGRQFFEAFKRNWRQATLVWVGIMVIAAIVVCDVVVASSMSAPARYLFEVVAALVGLLTVAIGQYYFILLSRYDNPIAKHLENAAKCAVGFFPRTVAMLAIMGIVAFLCLRYLFPALPLIILGGFSLPQYCCAWLYNPILVTIDGKRQAGDRSR